MNNQQISIVASGVIDLISEGKEVYRLAAKAMDIIEQNKNLSGADKKAWVIAFLKYSVIDIGLNWKDYADVIIVFIDKIKTVYNTVKSFFN